MHTIDHIFLMDFYCFIQYSSRDEVTNSSSDSKPTPRFGSISSPSSYRPSYSGGTYRSIGIKRETPVTSSYTNRWLSSNKDVASKETVASKRLSTQNENKLTKNLHNSTTGSLTNKSRVKEPTPSAIRPTLTVAKVRIRDVGLSNSSYSSSKSRDPSPSEPAKDRYTSSSGYVSSSYSKLYPRNSNKLQVNSFRSRSTSPAVSYLNGSDVAGRYRQNVESDENAKKISSTECSPTKETPPMKKDSDSNETHSDQSIEMIEVTVVTRATSPNLCPSSTTTNFTRCRRAEIAKTIEKTVMRAKQKPSSEDKEMQSDRMDDTSKYYRFSTRSSTPWPSYGDSKYNSMSYTRYNSSSNGSTSSKYHHSTKAERDSNESSPEKNVEKSIEKSPEKSPSKSRESSISKSPSISRSNSIKSVSKSEKSKSKSPPTLAPKSTSSSPSKQKVYNSKTLPPQAPKLESPTKVISAPTSTSTSSASSSNSKWANKDFRKSALNVGQTDRPRKARTSSAIADNEDGKKAQQKAASDQVSHTRSDRSSSVSSESSGNADDLAKNLIKLKISATPSATATVTLIKANEIMHLNSDTMTCELKSKPNDAVQIQPTNSNDSCMKTDNTQPNIVNRMLGPVMKIFKNKSQHFGDSQSCSEHENAVSVNDSIKQGTLIESMLNQTTITTTNGAKLVSSNNYLADESSWINSTLNEQTTDTQFNQFQSIKSSNMKDQLTHVESNSQLPWWLNEIDNDDTVAEDITLNQSDNETTRFNKMDVIETNQIDPEFPWWTPNESAGQDDTGQKYRITHVRSGERAWWLDEDTEESVNDILEAAETENQNQNGAKFTFKIKKIESGERAWWLCEENQDTTATEPIKQNIIDDNDNDNVENGDDTDFWATINESLEAKRKASSKAQQNQLRQQNENKYSNNYQYDINANYIPLGDRASPEGLEDLRSGDENRLSPYDNVTNQDVDSALKKLFISKHQNIDDVLGVPCHTLSPIRLETKDDGSFEEILPSQVRIHEGSPKKPYLDHERCVSFEGNQSKQ